MAKNEQKNIGGIKGVLAMKWTDHKSMGVLAELEASEREQARSIFQYAIALVVLLSFSVWMFG